MIQGTYAFNTPAVVRISDGEKESWVSAKLHWGPVGLSKDGIQNAYVCVEYTDKRAPARYGTARLHDIYTIPEIAISGGIYFEHVRRSLEDAPECGIPALADISRSSVTRSKRQDIEEIMGSLGAICANHIPHREAQHGIYADCAR